MADTDTVAGAVPGRRIRELIAQGADEIPSPGHGETLLRWQRLAEVASEDLGLVKLFEGHTDALAIMAELGTPPDATGSAEIWGTWAAEPPSARLRTFRDGDRLVLDGRKSWCSGADVVSYAVVTAWDEQGRQCLAAVRMDEPGVAITDQGWHAVGMGTVATPDVRFNRVTAVPVGSPGQYVQRPGFWQGGCGIAACWYGGTVLFAEAVAQRCADRPDPHALAHLGAIDTALHGTRALLAEAATWIDRNPTASAQQWALRVRASAESTVAEVIERAGRALGAGPLCRDPRTARRFADLPVFVRQSHAEHDLAALGETLAADPSAAGQAWSLRGEQHG
jgi:alkylation response protein AidB-like acyl-CoA dehydrogenase